MQKLIIIVGPTASGKSGLAVRLAKKLALSRVEGFKGAEIISADSRQVYRELPIGSGTVTKKEMAGIRHHLLGVASVRHTFNASHFLRQASRAIDDITGRGKLPIIAGGTAFWIDALVYDFSLPAVKPNSKLRLRLEKKSPAELLVVLKKLDPNRAEMIEQKNPRRLIRAIEIAYALGSVPALKKHPAYDVLWIGLNPSYETRSHRIWDRKIQRRVHAMITHGLVAETKKLLNQKLAEKRIREFGFEYAAVLDSITKKIPRRELAPRIIRDTARFAKRQLRWWKHNQDINWITAPSEAPRLVRTFLQKTP